MRPLMIILATALGILAVAPVKSAHAAPPVAMVSPGYDARLAQAHMVQASAHRRYHRHYRYYSGHTYPYDGYRPYYYRPYYYRPYPYGPFWPFFDFGW